VAELNADIPWIDRDAVAQPCQDHILDVADPLFCEHLLEDIEHHRMRALDEVTHASLRFVGPGIIMRLGH